MIHRSTESSSRLEALTFFHKFLNSYLAASRDCPSCLLFPSFLSCSVEYVYVADLHFVCVWLQEKKHNCMNTVAPKSVGQNICIPQCQKMHLGLKKNDVCWKNKLDRTQPPAVTSTPCCCRTEPGGGHSGCPHSNYTHRRNRL